MTSQNKTAAASVAAGSATNQQLDLLGEAVVKEIKTNSELLQVRARSSKRLSLNEDSRTITYIVSDETPDRVGDIISVRGWDIETYKSNPVILWGHDQSIPPIGRAKNVRRRYSDAARLTADIEFAPEEAHAFADTIYQLAARDFIRATSVGFLPHETKELNDKQRQKLGLGKYGQFYSKAELMEVSVVAVPANPSALEDGVKALVAGGLMEKSIAPDFLRAYPANEEEALKRARAACRSFIDLGALVAKSSKAVAVEEKSPACRMDGETKPECVERKIPELIEEGMDQDQAVAVANSVCEEACDEKSAEQPTTKDVDKLREARDLILDGVDVIDEAIDMYADDEPEVDEDEDEDYGFDESEEESSSRRRRRERSSSDTKTALGLMTRFTEQMIEHTKATRQLVDALSDLTAKVHQSRGGDDTRGAAAPETRSSDAHETLEEKVDGVFKSAVRGFAERINERDFSNRNSKQN